tara:strand:- start:1753 stop:1995 length:243 start_codon:yes stop_codon:yes gene_type:complete
MALNYRYNKEGKVTGIRWGKGPNHPDNVKKNEKESLKAKKKSKTSVVKGTMGGGKMQRKNRAAARRAAVLAARRNKNKTK